VDVYDKDTDWDDHLGGFSIDIISVVNNLEGTMFEWFEMNGDDSGSVRLQLSFLELSQNKLHHGIKPTVIPKNKNESKNNENSTESVENSNYSKDLGETLQAKNLGGTNHAKDLETLNVLTSLVQKIMKFPMNPNRFVLGLYLDSVEETSIKKQMVVNVIITETIAGREIIHTRKSKIATGPNYNFAETFFVFLEYAHNVKINIDMCYPHGLGIKTTFLLENDIHCQFNITSNDFNKIFDDPMWTLKKSIQTTSGKLNYNLCVRSLDGQLKCVEIPDLIERAKTKRDGAMARLKKFLLKPSSAFSPSTLNPKQRLSSFKKPIKAQKMKKQRKLKINRKLSTSYK